jgi:hypothetical protein
MKLFRLYISIAMFFVIIFSGCKESPTEANNIQSETLVFEKPNLVDSLVGTCSAYLIRTMIFDSIDIRNYSKIKINFTAYTDGDLSGVSAFYTYQNNNINLFELSGTSQINNTNSITITSPKIKDNIYLRLKLFSSVCTGQYYHLKIRDLKFFGIN